MVYSQIRFKKFKKFVSRSVFGELQLILQTSSCNLRGLEAKQNCAFFYYFDSKRNYDVLKSKRPCFLSNKKNETESKLENPS